MRLSPRLALSALTIALALPTSAQPAAPELVTLRSKAEAGNVIAQYNLGLAYAEGRGVSADPIEAYVWLQLAANNGATGKALDSLLARLNPAELATGRERLAARQAAMPSAAATIPNDVLALQARLREVETAATELAAKNQQLEDVASERGRALAAAKTEASELRTRLEADRLKPESVEQAKADAARVTQLSAEREVLNGRLAAAELAARSASEANMRVNNLNHQLDAAQAELKEVKASLGTAKAAADSAQAAAGDQAKLASQISTLETERAKLREQLAAAESASSAASSAGANLAAANAQVQAAEKQATELRTQLAALQADREKAQAAATTATSEAAALREQVNALTQKVSTLSTPAPAVAPVPDLSKELAEAQEKLELTVRSFAQLQEENTRLRAAAEAAAAKPTPAPVAPADSAELASLREQLRQAQDRVAALSQENARPRPAMPSVASAVPSAPVASVAPAPAPSGSVRAAPTRPGAVVVPVEKPAPPAPAIRTHVVAIGDTLTKISTQYYGTPSRWREILAANSDTLHDEKSLVVGASLKIP